MKNNAPLIGITLSVLLEDGGKVRHTAQPAYAACVIAAGGVPVYLPPTENPVVLRHYVEALDGLLLSGGARPPCRGVWSRSRPGNQPHASRTLCF